MYTINGKEYSEFGINKRCAEIIGEFDLINESIRSRNAVSKRLGVGKTLCLSDIYNPCQNPSDTWSIIEKVWDELVVPLDHPLGPANHWEHLIEKHNCTKLTAVCICLIELNP